MPREPNDLAEQVVEDVHQLLFSVQIDEQIRKGIYLCWTGIPQERRNVEELEKQVGRLVRRAMCDFREDLEAFAIRSESTQPAGDTPPLITPFPVS